MKKIYIEGLGLVEGHFSGVGQYILGILRGLDQIIDDAQYSGKIVPEIKVIIPYDTVATFKKFGFKHITYKRFPLPFKVMGGLWYKGKLPPIDLWCGKGSYIFTRFVDMPLLFSRSATVIYDLSYELYRQYSDERNAQFLSRRVKDTLNTTDKIIAISNNAKREIVDFYKLNDSRVVVATPATDPRLFYRRSTKEIETVKRKYGIEGDYILALSNLEPRKNLDALVKAYCKLDKKILGDTSLLLVGVSGWKTEKLFHDIVKKVSEGYSIVRPSEYVLDADKPAIISGAKMLVYPSHYEGFGMPPLEALACGIPVISSDNSSLPEVMGTIGTMIPSNSQAKLIRAIESYLVNNDDEKLKAVTYGPKQAEKFSWIKSAQVFLDVAEDLSK